MKSITDIPDLKGKRVFVRVDWNVPMKDGKVLDDFRIKKSIPTLEYLRNAGAQVTIATHVAHGSVDPLVPFVPPSMTLLPNLRDNPGEEANSEEFALELAAQSDIYVNEAFPESHREYASIVRVPKLLPSYAGFRFLEEVNELSKAFNPPTPSLLILGGAKFETKIPLVNKFINIVDYIFIGGANAKPAFETDLRNNPKIFFPHGDIGALDADEETIEDLKSKIKQSEFVLWNGPLGNYEKGFKKGTLELAKILSESGKQVIVGGGDTLASIRELNIYDKFSFVSTAGAAMLDFLVTGTLPGIEALKLSQVN